jgi:uncharacterized membrane protein HdeD (DUF308 family)
MNHDNWKWWYYVLLGILILAFAGYEIYELRIGKAIGSVILGLILIAVGTFSRKTASEPKKPVAAE